MEKLKKFKKSFKPLKINPIYLKTSGYHIGYRTNRPEEEEPVMKPIAKSHYGGMKKKKREVQPQQPQIEEQDEEVKGYENV